MKTTEHRDMTNVELKDEVTLRLSTLVPLPTQITETLWGPKLAADSCTEADTATAWARWCSQHTGGDAA